MKFRKTVILSPVLIAVYLFISRAASAGIPFSRLNTADAVSALFPALDAPAAPPEPAFAAADEASKKKPQRVDGVPVRNIGCYYSGVSRGNKHGKKHRKKTSLLIYYRGHLSDFNYPGGGLSGGHITGESDILRSARAALAFYGLKKLALDKGLVVLVTGSSDIQVVQADVEKLQRKLGYVFQSVYVAAHSGGYVGFSASIGALDRVDGIVLLDPFYSDFSANIRPFVQSGSACSGFYTPHNESRYKKYFSGLPCEVEARTSPSNHEAWVPSCLENNIPCALKPHF